MLTAAGERIADRRLERKGRVPDGNQPAGPGAEQKPWGLGGGEGKKKKKNPKQGTGLMGAMQISLRGIKKK